MQQFFIYELIKFTSIFHLLYNKLILDRLYYRFYGHWY